MKKMHKEKTLKMRIVKALTLLLIPLVILLNIYAFSMLQTVNENLAAVNTASLQRFCNQVESVFNYAEKSILDLVNFNEDFAHISLSQDELSLYGSRYAVLLNLKSMLLVQPEVAGFVFTDPAGGTTPVYNSNFTGVKVKEEIKQWFSNWSYNEWIKLDGEWKLLQFHGEHFLGRAVTLNGKTIVALIRLSVLEKLGDFPVAFMQGDEYITQLSYISDNGISKPSKTEKFKISSKNMLLQMPLAKTNLSVVYVVPYKGFFSGISIWNIGLLVASLLTVLIVPLAYLWVSKAIFQPVSQLVAVMEKIRTGNLQLRAQTNYKEKEFKVMSLAFNHMLDQVNSWKIAYYEEELEAKQAKMDYMQMQIRPHFYINCLKNIFSMMHEKRYDDIQDMLVSLSDYLRYMMSQTGGTVSLAQELESIQTYIQLQNFIMAYPPQYSAKVDEELLMLQIPPASLLTFVENCIKHAQTDGALNICIKGVIGYDNENKLAILTVKDNGIGFTSEMLYKLNHCLAKPENGKHIGIYNTVSRFKSQMGKSCEIAFSNNNGAQIDVFFSIVQKGRDNLEIVNC